MTRRRDASVERTRPAASAPGWRRVLVLHIGSLGDTVLSLPALHALRAAVGPDARITLLHDAPPAGRVDPLAVLPAGLVDDARTFPGPRHAGSPTAPSAVARAADVATRSAAAVALLAQLRRDRYDAVVDLTLTERPLRARRRDAAFFAVAGIGRRLGFDGDAVGLHEADARVARLAAAGLVPADPTPTAASGPVWEASAEAAAEAAGWRTSAGIDPEADVVTVAPATLMDAKRWPVDRWAALGAALVAAGRVPVVVGGPADRTDGDALVAAWGGGANAAGALSVAGSGALMAAATCHVGLDTGTTHLAAAAGTPVVALYSQRAPVERWAPMGVGHRVLTAAPVACAGCFAVTCPEAGHPCMRHLALDDVLEAMARAQAAAAPGAAGERR